MTEGATSPLSERSQPKSLSQNQMIPMGSVHENGFNTAIEHGAANGQGEIEYNTQAGGACPTEGANPRSLGSFAFVDGGNNVPKSSITFPTFQASNSSDIEEVVLYVNDPDNSGPSGDVSKFLTVDSNTSGSGFPETYGTGAEVTVNAGYVDFGSNGLARAVADGLQSYKYELRDGNGNKITTITPSDGAHVSIVYDSGGQQFRISNTLSITNTSGSQWNVERIDVRDNGNGALLFNSTGFSANVVDNGTINFTTLELDVTLP